MQSSTRAPSTSLTSRKRKGDGGLLCLFPLEASTLPLGPPLMKTEYRRFLTQPIIRSIHLWSSFLLFKIVSRKSHLTRSKASFHIKFKDPTFFFLARWSSTASLAATRMGSKICLPSINVFCKGANDARHYLFESFCQHLGNNLVSQGCEANWSEVFYSPTWLAFLPKFQKTRKNPIQCLLNSTVILWKVHQILLS